MLEVPLFPGLPGGRWARLGPLTGAIEADVEPDDPGAFGRLVDQLLQPAEGTTVAPNRAFDLAVSDLDRLAAALYRRYFGERLESRLECGRCGRPFEVNLELDGLVDDAPQAPPPGIEGPDGEGWFQLGDGARFRLPTLRDQIAVRHLMADEAGRMLRDRCLAGGTGEGDPPADLEPAMAAVGPLASGEVAVPCPHCHYDENRFDFALQASVLEALAFERGFLHHEVHYLARAYGWGRTEILALPREDRWRHVRIILAERTGTN